MKFYKLEMPAAWQSSVEDATFYRQIEDERLEVLNYNGEWQPSMHTSIEEAHGYYCFDDEEREDDSKWKLYEVTEQEVKDATEG